MVLNRPRNPAQVFCGLCLRRAYSLEFNPQPALRLFLPPRLRKDHCCGERGRTPSRSRKMGGRCRGEAQTYFTHQKTRKLEKKARPGKRRDRTPGKEARARPARKPSVFPSSAGPAPDACGGSRPRAHKATALWRWAEQSCERPPTRPITRLCRLREAQLSLHPFTGARGRARARMQSHPSWTLDRAKLNASVNLANRASLPPPVRPRPRDGTGCGRGGAHFLLWGKAKGGGVPAAANVSERGCFGVGCGVE